MILILKKEKIIIATVILIAIVLTAYIFKVIDFPAIKATNNEVKNKIVVLDAGHGGEDPGAVSDFSGIREKEINLYIAQKVKELLKAENFTVIMTREDDTLKYTEGTKKVTEKRRQDLINRKKIMDESGAELVVSIHLNKFPQEQYYGAQVFYPPNSPESKTAAELIQKSLKEIVDPENKRVAMLKKAEIIILKNLKTPTVIVECGFLSNPQEEKKLATVEYQDKLALAIKEGIMKYYEN
ncbi:N-acetylmuramoyl-L-alanine amidase CwlD [Acetivibrio clariflavus]|uniref:N-acetylmuramoyl-L-alanine amidase CwlD n=1 Tax=Acetivibrio clariflavus (strain DSM 19732 / NBRC 101661 / EBR45) TaxID=720554 RepID=G8LT40_ACECE|nr:N-acetylmuramoyl-L-alanine amidase CwlD [Acetivibrio clariflavus]AEV67244.1 N-acetylmuramoyl-L-alanine amidase CwlD [Acetivibrio clariflavus DSM 19732]